MCQAKNTLAAIAIVCSSTIHAADYIGTDGGGHLHDGNGPSMRIYAAHDIGSISTFGADQMHAVEAMAFSLALRTNGGDPARTLGLGISWTTATRLDERWALNSRLGLQFANTTVRYRPWPGQQDTTEKIRKADILVSVGAAYQINSNVALTADISYMPVPTGFRQKLAGAIVTAGARYAF
jgi:opacity protein-like surface antigen